MQPLGSPGAGRRRAVLAVLLALGVATVGTLAVAATQSTAAGYTVAVGTPVAEVPEDATVVGYDALQPTLRQRLAAADGAAEGLAVTVRESPGRAVRVAAYVEYRDDYLPITVTAERGVTAPGKVALGLVYLAALLVAALAPGRWHPGRRSA